MRFDDRGREGDGIDASRERWTDQVLKAGLFYVTSRFQAVEGEPDPPEWLEVFETDEPDLLNAYERAIEMVGPAAGGWGSSEVRWLLQVLFGHHARFMSGAPAHLAMRDIASAIEEIQVVGHVFHHEPLTPYAGSDRLSSQIQHRRPAGPGDYGGDDFGAGGLKVEDASAP